LSTATAERASMELSTGRLHSMKTGMLERNVELFQQLTRTEPGEQIIVKYQLFYFYLLGCWTMVSCKQVILCIVPWNSMSGTVEMSMPVSLDLPLHPMKLHVSHCRNVNARFIGPPPPYTEPQFHKGNWLDRTLAWCHVFTDARLVCRLLYHVDRLAGFCNVRLPFFLRPMRVCVNSVAWETTNF